MADIKRLEDKVVNAEAKVEKCKGTIERHGKQLEKKINAVVKTIGLDLTGKTKEEIDELRNPYRNTDHSWTIYEVISKLDDIKGAKKKLAEAEQVLENWKEKLSLEQEKERFLSDNAPAVIKEFLEQWKQLAYKWHVKRYDAYQEYKEKLNREEREARIQFVKNNTDLYERYLTKDGEIKEYFLTDHGLINMFPRKPMDEHLKEKNLYYSDIEKRKASFAGGTVMYMDTIRDEEERLAWLEKVLEQEKKAKMLDLINRINKVTGTIVDASGLSISEVGNLNGVIVGEKAKAKVETIGAGGYAVQCFHYRTLVHKIK